MIRKTQFKKKYILPVVAGVFLFVGSSFRDDFFEIAKQIEIFTTLFKTVNANYVDETGNVLLVSENKQHQDKEIEMSKIRALALIKASIRINAML